jgi:hypothetical protein
MNQDAMFSSIADSYERRMAEARAAEWLRIRGLQREDSIPVEALPSILIEFSRIMNEAMKHLCNHYQKMACDALNLKLPPPFEVDPDDLFGTKKKPSA